MLEIKSVLTHIMNGIAKQDPRYIIQGDEHITDTKTGIILHVYDDWFKVTYEDDNVLTYRDFTPEEQLVVWNIKKLITDPSVLEQREKEYKPLQVARRKRFSELHENPTPLPDNAPVAEKGATAYTG